MLSKQGRRQGGAKGAAAPPNQKKKKKERGEEERKKEEREKRNQKRKEVEPVIARTCGYRPLLAPRPPGSPKTPDRNVAGISRLASAPPSVKSCLRPCYFERITINLINFDSLLYWLRDD